MIQNLPNIYNFQDGQLFNNSKAIPIVASLSAR